MLKTDNYFFSIAQKIFFAITFGVFCASIYNKKEEMTFILQIQKTANINGQLLDNQSEMLVYTMRILTKKGNENPIQMKESYYFFEDKQD